MKIFAIVILSFSALISCNMKADKKVSYYFDTDSLMRAQKEMILKRDASISKRATVNGIQSKATVTPDSIEAWNNEFQIFQKININKPANKGVYKVTEYSDTKSNLRVREYKTDDKNAEVKFLKIYYLGSVENLRIIEAQHVENNPIFHSRRDLRFVFDDFSGLALLHQYKVKGHQKMILKDSVEFEVKSKLKF